MHIFLCFIWPRGADALHRAAHGHRRQLAEAEAQESTADLVEKFRSKMQNIQRDLSFSVDDSTGDVVVRVIDGESGKIVRQIPSEEILRLTERLDEMRSLLFEAKA